MSELSISIITFAFVFGGALLGMYLRNALPGHHLRNDVKDVVRLSTGLIGTMAALVLGLLDRIGQELVRCENDPDQTNHGQYYPS